MLVVLVGLDGDAGQGGVGSDVIGLPQGAVAGGKAPIKELDQVDLGAGGGAHGGKVHVVDMDVPAGVGPGMLGLHDEHLVELLGPLAAVLEHGAHGGVPVDVGVLPLDVAVLGGGEGDVLIDLHEAGVHLPGPAALRAVEDIGLGGLDIAVVHQHPLHDVLDVLHLGAILPSTSSTEATSWASLAKSLLVPGLIGGRKGLIDGIRDLIFMEGDHSSVPFPNLLCTMVIERLSFAEKISHDVTSCTYYKTVTHHLVPIWGQHPHYSLAVLCRQDFDR